MAQPNGPTPEAQYDEFVKSTLRHLQRGLELDGTTKKQKIGKVLGDRLKDPTSISAAQRAIEGRFALGGDDAAYLQSGLATLWTTATENGSGGASSEELAPPGLYAPDAVDGIRQGLIRALQDKSATMQKDAPAVLTQLAAPLKALLGVDAVRDAVVPDMQKQYGAATIKGVADVEAIIIIDWTDQTAWTKDDMAKMFSILIAFDDFLEAKKGFTQLSDVILDAIQKQATKIANQGTMILNLNDVNDQLKADYSKLDGQFQAEKKQLEAACEAEKVTLRGEVDDLKKKSAAQLRTNQMQVQLRNKLVAERDAARADRDAKAQIYQAAADRFEEKKKALANQLADTQAALTQCQQELAALRTQGQKDSALEQRAEELRIRVQELEDEKNQSKRAYTMEEGAYRARLEKYEEEKAAYEKAIEDQLDLVAAANSQVSAVQAQLTECLERERKLNEEIAELKAELIKCEAKLKKQGLTCTATNTSLSKALEERDKCREELRETKAANAASKNRIKELEANARTAEAEALKAAKAHAAAIGELEAQRADRQDRMQKLRDLVYHQSDALAAAWKTTTGDWIRAADPDADEVAQRDIALDISRKLGTLGMRRVLNDHIGDYALIDVHSTRAVIAASGMGQALAPEESKVCAALGSLLRTKNPKFQEGGYGELMSELCQTMRSWGLYKRSGGAAFERAKRGEGKPFMVHVPFCSEKDVQGVFVPLTDQALRKAEASDNADKMGKVLNYLFNLPDDGRWTIETLENDTFPHLFLNIKGTPVGDAVETESALMGFVGAIGAAGKSVWNFLTGWNANNDGAVEPPPVGAQAAAVEAARAAPDPVERTNAMAATLSRWGKGVLMLGAVRGVGDVGEVEADVPPASDPFRPNATPTAAPSELASITAHAVTAPPLAATTIVAMEAARRGGAAPGLLRDIVLNHSATILPMSVTASPEALQEEASKGDAKATQTLTQGAPSTDGTFPLVAFSGVRSGERTVAALWQLAKDRGAVIVEGGGQTGPTVTAASFQRFASKAQTSTNVMPPGATSIAEEHIGLLMTVMQTRIENKVAFFKELVVRHGEFKAEGRTFGRFLRQVVAPAARLTLPAPPTRLTLPAPPPARLALPPPPGASTPSPAPPPFSLSATLTEEQLIETCVPSCGLRLPRTTDANTPFEICMAIAGNSSVSQMVAETPGYMEEDTRPTPVVPDALTEDLVTFLGDPPSSSAPPEPSLNVSADWVRCHGVEQAIEFQEEQEQAQGEAMEDATPEALAPPGRQRSKLAQAEANRGTFRAIGAWAANTSAFWGDRFWTAAYTAAQNLSLDAQRDPTTLELAEAVGAGTTCRPRSHGDIQAIRVAVSRGLVGQRGPTEAAADGCPQDALLPYAMPSVAALARCMPALRQLLATTPDPTSEEVARARAHCAGRALATAARGASERGAATAVLEAPSTRLAALHALEGNFAITATEAAREDDARGGVEMPHGVRWMPTGPRAGAMARAAVLEHAIARCTQVADDPATTAAVGGALRGAAAALKLRQLEGLYGLHEAIEYEDRPPPLGTATPLVTRPCAVVHGALAFPLDHGVVRVPNAAAPKLDASADEPMGAAADLEAAMAKTRAPTRALRNALRRRAAEDGTEAALYVAPPAAELAFRPAPARTPAATGVRLDAFACQRVQQGDFSVAMWRRIINRAIVHIELMDGPRSDAVRGFLEAAASGDVPGTFVSALDRRDALWSEFRRNVAISQDRLWVFVRLMSGCVGGDVNEVITMADEATLKATKAIQDQRVAIAKRVSDMQAKLVETIVGGMVRESRLALDKRGTPAAAAGGLMDASELVVIDAAARQELSDLASGESGRPFFEANVAVRNLQAGAAGQTTRLSDLLQSLANVGAQLQESLEATLTQSGAATASLTELSHPSNCYFVSMRADASAAIRIAHERVNVELGIRRAGRRVTLWELVEGGCLPLTTRFAEFAGYVLVQARSSTGISALYVSQQAIQTNAHQARMSLDKLIRVASVYARAVPSPPDFAAGVGDAMDARAKAMNAGAGVDEIAIGHQLAGPAIAVGTKLAPSVPLPPSGWWVTGAARS